MTDQRRERLGFIGLGDMGLPMAERLINSGAALSVFDLKAEPLRLGAAAGAIPRPSVAEVARNSDIVFVCVVDSDQVLDVVIGPAGLLRAWEARATDCPTPLVVVHSTVTPSIIKSLVGPAQAVGARVLDAAVSGGRAVAAEGKLTIMVGGAERDVRRCQPFFDAMATSLFHISDEPGSGAMAKLCNNVMALCNAFATLEATKLAQAYGIQEEKLMTIASASTGDSWFVRNWGFIDRIMATHDFPESTMTKDLVYAVEAASEAGIDLPLVRTTIEVAPALLRERLDVHSHQSVQTTREAL